MEVDQIKHLQLNLCISGSSFSLLAEVVYITYGIKYF